MLFILKNKSVFLAVLCILMIDLENQFSFTEKRMQSISLLKQLLGSIGNVDW